VVEWGDERWLRAYGSLPHPNMLAAFLVIALIFILGLSFIAETRQKRLFLALSYLLIIPALVFSFSRAAWLVLGLAYVVTIVWMIYKKHKSVLTIQLLVLGALLVVLISAVFWHPVSARLFGGERLETISNQTRLALYEESKTLIAGSWYRGVGLGNYTLAVFRLIDGSQAVYLYQPVHNIFLLILSELGIFGLLFYLAAIIYLLKTKEGWISKLAFIGLLIIGLFDHFLWSLYFGVMLWWLVAGLVQGKAREEN